MGHVAVNKPEPETRSVNRTMPQTPVNKRGLHRVFVNRLSALQLAILTELAASRWQDPFSGAGRSGGLPMHGILRRVFRLSLSGFTGATASQRASLSRSLRRLERAGFIDKRYGAYSAAITRRGRAALREIGGA